MRSRQGTAHSAEGSWQSAGVLTLAVMLLALSSGHPVRADSAPEWLDAYRTPATRLIAEATRDTFAWRRLSALTDTIGNRLSGSPQLDQAIACALAVLKRDAPAHVHPANL